MKPARNRRKLTFTGRLCAQCKCGHKPKKTPGDYTDDPKRCVNCGARLVQVVTCSGKV